MIVYNDLDFGRLLSEVTVLQRTVALQKSQIEFLLNFAAKLLQQRDEYGERQYWVEGDDESSVRVAGTFSEFVDNGIKIFSPNTGRSSVVAFHTAEVVA